MPESKKTDTVQATVTCNVVFGEYKDNICFNCLPILNYLYIFTLFMFPYICFSTLGCQTAFIL